DQQSGSSSRVEACCMRRSRLNRHNEPESLRVELAQVPALDICHVSHPYGARVALNDVSLTVRQSSFTVLLGLNGAGKSTLFSLITRLYAIQSGQIRIFGPDVASEAGAALSRLGVVFQCGALEMEFSCGQHVMHQ